MPTCTTASLTAESGFGLAGLNDTQYKAALIYFKVLELAALGGTDYSATMTTTLIQDAIALKGGMSRDQYQIALLTIARNNAVAAGATVPDTLSELNAATACCFQATAYMDAILLLLECELGVHAAV